MSVAVMKTFPSVMSTVKSALAAVAAVFANIAAASAVANALENHRQPSDSDLRVLGMEGVRFKHY